MSNENHLKNVKILHKIPIFSPMILGLAVGRFCPPQYLVVISRKTAETLGISGFFRIFPFLRKNEMKNEKQSKTA